LWLAVSVRINARHIAILGLDGLLQAGLTGTRRVE
jgi:hypothetical protein